MTNKLDDLQQALLTAATKRKDGSVLPFPKGIDASRCTRAVTLLLRCGLVAEIEVTGRKSAWREEGGHRFGLVLTDAGYVALEKPEPPTDTPPSAAGTKIQCVIQLLSDREGASVAELMKVTGWLPHTTRAALTGLRKKGHLIIRDKDGDETRYHIAARA